MPTNRRRRRVQIRPGSALTAGVRLVLELGDDIVGEFDITGDELDQHLARLWKQHRKEVLAGFIVKFPGERPELWWEHDAPEPRPPLGPFESGSFESYEKARHNRRIKEIAVLVRHGLLTREEQAALEAKAKKEGRV